MRGVCDGTTMVSVARVATSRQLADALALRRAVLADADCPAIPDRFDLDPATLHCVVLGPDGACIGAGRLTAPVGSEAGGDALGGSPTVGPIVVAESARGAGVATAILAFLEAEALALYGRNGTVRIDATIPASVPGHAGVLGYTVVAPGARRAALVRATGVPSQGDFARRAPVQR